MVNIKMCNVCKYSYPCSYFYKNKNKPLGLHYECKKCFNKYIKNYNQRPNVKKHKKIEKLKYYKANKTQIIKSVNQWQKERDGGLFKKFLNAKARCNYKSHSRYKIYGGRGVQFCWKKYEEFKKDMENSFIKHKKIHGHKNTTLDRIDVNGNYCKENCRWATWSIQSKNRRKYKKYVEK